MSSFICANRLLSHRYMEEKVPLSAVDVDAGMKSKFGDLVMDACESALWILLMNQVME